MIRMKAKFCPVCGKDAGDAVFCSSCGYNFETGKQQTVTQEKEKNSILPMVLAILLVVALIATAIFVLIIVEIPDVMDTYDDTEFLDWMTYTVNENLMTDFTMIGTYADSYDLDNLAKWSQKLEDHSSLYLSQIDNFHVSPKMQKVKDETKLALEDCEMAGYYGKLGAENISPDDLDIAVLYMNDAVIHINTVTEYLNDM